MAQALDGRRLVLKPHPLAPDNPLLGLLRQRCAGQLTEANVYALLAAATLHRLAGDGESRRSCLERATQRSPHHALAQHNLGNLLMAEGRFDLALERFRAAAASNRRLWSR